MDNLDLLKDIDIVGYLEERDVVEGVVGKHNVTVTKDTSYNTLNSVFEIVVGDKFYKLSYEESLLNELQCIKYYTVSDMNKKLDEVEKQLERDNLEKELRKELKEELQNIKAPLSKIKNLLEIAKEQEYNVSALDESFSTCCLLRDVMDVIRKN